jgi:hypothetical protein
MLLRIVAARLVQSLLGRNFGSYVEKITIHARREARQELRRKLKFSSILAFRFFLFTVLSTQACLRAATMAAARTK